ncbi:MAG: multidrug effflux MFS transporter [Steroidobacteraceae bacterium]|nr:multidrug effflux MFS transporter [Steroidobacteraceae bacterium]
MNASLRPSRARLAVLLGALTATGPWAIDMYLPALPALANDLGTTLGAAQGTLSAFFLGMAIGQLVYGPLADRYGRRPPMLAGLALFTVASIACALATDVGMLWIARLAQALGSCAGLVVARAVARDLYEPLDVAHIFSRLMLVTGIAPILAPLIGAQVLALAGWRTIFWSLAAFGAVLLVFAAHRLPETHGGTPGAARPRVVARTFLAILRDRSFLRPSLIAALGQSTLFAYIVGTPAVLIEHFGVDPRLYGFFFGANALGFIVSAQVNARWLRGRGPARLLRGGLLALLIVASVGLAVAWSGIGGVWAVSATYVAQLGALGFVMSNAGALALAQQGARAGSASAVLGSLQFGIAALASSAVATLTALEEVANPVLAVALVVAACAGLAFLLGRRAVSA